MMKKVRVEFDQVYEGELLIIKEGEEQDWICCDCGLTHKIKFTIQGKQKGKRKLIIDMRRNVKVTNAIRRNGMDETEDGYRIKVTKIKEIF